MLRHNCEARDSRPASARRAGAAQRSRWRRRSPAARASPRARTAGTAGSIFTRTSADVSVPRPRTYDDRTAGSSLITLITYFSIFFFFFVAVSLLSLVVYLIVATNCCARRRLSTRCRTTTMAGATLCPPRTLRLPPAACAGIRNVRVLGGGGGREAVEARMPGRSDTVVRKAAKVGPCAGVLCEGERLVAEDRSRLTARRPCCSTSWRSMAPTQFASTGCASADGTPA